MSMQKIISACIIFLLGFLSANVAALYIDEIEVPFTDFSFNNDESAPFDFIKENQIEIYDDKVVINIEGASLSRYAPTGSMEPILDENSNGIKIKPESEEDVHVGDIVTFKQNNILIVHRVIEKGVDGNGTYFITKGDNNLVNDGKIRFDDVEYITIGMIW